MIFEEICCNVLKWVFWEGQRCGWHAGLRGGISVSHFTVISLLPQVNDVLGYAWPKNAGLCPVLVVMPW